MKSLVLIITLTLLVGCGSDSNNISAVTPIPTQLTSTPTPTPTTEVTEVEPTVEPTTRLEATATQVGASRSTGSNNFALMTPTPQDNQLEPGVAREIALATDVLMEPEFAGDAQRISFEEAPVPVQFSEFYDGFSIRTGLIFSDKLKSLDGQEVVIEGYVAPPLKPKLDFFVLTRMQLAFCPFCSTDVEWPDDIALVYLPEQQIISSEYPVRIRGRLEVGSSVDAETGMVSLVRIYSEEMEVLN